MRRDFSHLLRALSLFARQCRYYSLGALLTLLSLYAFKEDWQSRFRPALLLCLSIALLFYTNYLLFFSFVMPLLLAGIWLYPREIALKRTIVIALTTLAIIVPGLLLFRIQAQSQIMNLIVIPKNLGDYLGTRSINDPSSPRSVSVWRWRRVFWTRAGIPGEPGEKFILFLGLIIVGNIIVYPWPPNASTAI